VRFGHSVFGASVRREKGKNRVVELLLALRDSQTVSLRVPSGHHVEVGARRPPGNLYPGNLCPENRYSESKMSQDTSNVFVYRATVCLPRLYSIMKILCLPDL
jgi:hypothetical protein